MKMNNSLYMARVQGAQVYSTNVPLKAGDLAGVIPFDKSKVLETEIQKQLEELRHE